MDYRGTIFFKRTEQIKHVLIHEDGGDDDDDDGCRVY
jgi:hypothetical protein